MGSSIYQMVKTFKPHTIFLVKLMNKHKFYQEIYVKNGCKSYYNMQSFYNSKNLLWAFEIIEKEIILLTETDIVTIDEAKTLKNMILHTEDEDNILIGMLLLKKHRKLLDKKLKDPIFESEFITNIACDYYNKIYKPYMERRLNQYKNK
jgi:hypothetical protein